MGHAALHTQPTRHCTCVCVGGGGGINSLTVPHSRWYESKAVDASSYVQTYTYYIHINGAYRKNGHPTRAPSAPPSGQVDLSLLDKPVIQKCQLIHNNSEMNKVLHRHPLHVTCPLE